MRVECQRHFAQSSIRFYPKKPKLPGPSRHKPCPEKYPCRTTSIMNEQICGSTDALARSVSQPILTHGTGEMTKQCSLRITQNYGIQQVPISPGRIVQPRSRFPAVARLSENLTHVEILLISHDEIARLTYLACQRLRRDNLFATCCLALMPSFGFWAIPPDEIRCFHVRP